MDKALAEILRKHKTQISQDWVSLIQSIPDSKYKTRPLSELQASTGESVLACIDIFENGTYERMDRFIQSVSTSRIQMGFEISEVIEALLAFQEAVLPYLIKYSECHSDFFQKKFGVIQHALRYCISKFSSIYSAAQQSQLKKTLDETDEYKNNLIQQKLFLERKLKEINSLITSVRIIASSLDLETVLNYIIEQASDLLSCEISAIYELDENTKEMVLRIHRGPLVIEKATLLKNYPVSPEELRKMIDEQFILHISDTQKEILLPSALHVEELIDLNIRALLGVPMISQDEVVGAIALFHTRPYVFSFDEISLLKTFSNYAALAVKNARLFHHSRKAAVLEERNRLAREIHDNLAQGLTAIVIHLEIIERLVAKNPESIKDELDKVKVQARKNLAEARRSVWDLRAGASEFLSLPESIKKMIDEIPHSAGLDAHFRLVGEPVIFIPEANAHILRIFQEAINNVVQHAKADNVWVSLKYEEPELNLTVTDDGIGLQSVRNKVVEAQKGFGLLGMQERARILNGKFSVESSMDAGTTVSLKVPFSEWKK